MGWHMCTDEMQVMVWVGSEWSHERQKGVAAAVAYLVKDVDNLKVNSQRGQFTSLVVIKKCMNGMYVNVN